MRFTIRRADATDIDEILAFLDEGLRRDYFLRRGILRCWITGDNGDGTWRRPGCVLLAEAEGETVGIAIMSERSSRLFNLFVHPEWRGKGVGRKLLEACSPRTVRVKRDMSSGDPAGFYRRMGYIPEPYAEGYIQVWTREPMLPIGRGK